MWDAVYELMLASRLTHKHHAMFGTNTSRPNIGLYTTKKRPSCEDRLSWATWIRILLAK